ncbi:hypothetical protein FNH05_10420 [Amycolatopsis rhizosphaerae]|uniref:Uncharacterized protein n=1 Tax=Amycolatopsis rhizosphaerae TaxID=2053003 RepID=A0A558D0C2_9PSEU|nr:hypothetical protein [Amycolatopsis rhizosphaerae]TVT54443.1 hypothetical protein FNH05_10420 [Amycolatopsis rhizosphaerae]
MEQPAALPAGVKSAHRTVELLAAFAARDAWAEPTATAGGNPLSGKDFPAPSTGKEWACAS